MAMSGTRLRTTAMAATMAIMEEGVQPSVEGRPRGKAAVGAWGREEAGGVEVSRVMRDII
jgi:hypothetical protein